MNTAYRLTKLANNLTKHDMPLGAAFAAEGARELRKCYEGRKALADSHNALSDELLELKVKHGRLLVAHRDLQKSVDGFCEATRRLYELRTCRDQAD